jgi:hypothetical protein
VLDERPEYLGVVVVDEQLVERRAATYIVGADSGLGEAEEDPTGDGLLG